MTDQPIAHHNYTIQSAFEAEQKFLANASPELREEYLRQKRELERRVFNKMLYGNEEGVKDND